MVGQRKHAEPQSAGRHHHAATRRVGIEACAHRNDARGAQMLDGVGERLDPKVEYVIVRQARDTHSDGL
jgi:hypothetical protein